MKICKNTEVGGQRADGGNGEEQGILRSLIPSKEHSFHRFDVVSKSQKHETPAIMLMLSFTVSINHIKWVIAES